MDVVAVVGANEEAAAVVQPGEGAFDDPRVAAVSEAVFGLAASDDRSAGPCLVQLELPEQSRPEGAAALVALAAWVAVDATTGGESATANATALVPQSTYADPVLWLTPAQLAGVGLGSAYQPPGAQSSPSTAEVLASMSPQTRRSTEAVMNLTFEQLAAGGAVHP